MNDILKNWVNDPDYIMEKVSRHNVSVTITLHPDGMASIDIYPYPWQDGFVRIDEPSESCTACRIDIPDEDEYEPANCNNCRFDSNGECLLGGEPRIDGCEEFRTKNTCLTCRHGSSSTTSIENGDLKVLCELDEEFHYNSKPCNSWKGGTDE